MNKFDLMGKEAKEALDRMEEMMTTSRLSDLLHKKEEFWIFKNYFKNLLNSVYREYLHTEQTDIDVE